MAKRLEAPRVSLTSDIPTNDHLPFDNATDPLASFSSIFPTDLSLNSPASSIVDTSLTRIAHRSRSHHRLSIVPRLHRGPTCSITDPQTFLDADKQRSPMVGHTCYSLAWLGEKTRNVICDMATTRAQRDALALTTLAGSVRV